MLISLKKKDHKSTKHIILQVSARIKTYLQMRGK